MAGTKLPTLTYLLLIAMAIIRPTQASADSGKQASINIARAHIASPDALERCGTADRAANEQLKRSAKGNGQINLSSSNDRDYVRFYLTKSLQNVSATNRPIVIDIPNCMDFIAGGDYDWTDPSIYRAYFANASIRTWPLDGMPAENARNCQTFRIVPVSHVNRDECGEGGGSVIGIAASNQTNKELGLYSPNGGAPQWLPDITPNTNYTQRFVVNCNTYRKTAKKCKIPYQWWYGRQCNIRIVDGNGNKQCWAAGSDANHTGQIRALPCDGNSDEQLFSLGIAGPEFPGYNDSSSPGGQNTDGPLYGQDPLNIFIPPGQNP